MILLLLLTLTNGHQKLQIHLMVTNFLNLVLGLTAGLVAGGGPGATTLTSQSEEYDGSTWTAGGTLNAARNDNAGNGTQTAALMAGGRPAGSYPTGARNAETYNGTSWTSVSDAPPSTAVFVWAMTGVSTASIGVGAAGPSPLFAVYWDGSTWTDITASNSPHYIGGASGSQIKTFTTS
jgi:hypothetical protein